MSIEGRKISLDCSQLTHPYSASATLHAETAEAQHDTANQHHQEGHEARSLVKVNNELLNTQTDLILTISRTVATCATQNETQGLQSIMIKVLDTNTKIYQMVLDMQKAFQTQLPPQIDRQQPVYFEDAHGRITPFHIEFINSLDAFQAVMEARFRHVPGLKKVRRGEYLLLEANSKRKLDLQAQWDSVFLPGRKVVMSMTFQTPKISTSLCPGCQTENKVPADQSQSEVQLYVSLANSANSFFPANKLTARIPTAEYGMNGVQKLMKVYLARFVVLRPHRESGVVVILQIRQNEPNCRMKMIAMTNIPFIIFVECG